MELKNIQNFNLSSVNVTGVVAGYTSVLDTIDLGMLSQSLEDLRNVSCTPQPGLYIFKHFQKCYIRIEKSYVWMCVHCISQTLIYLIACFCT